MSNLLMSYILIFFFQIEDIQESERFVCVLLQFYNDCFLLAIIILL